MIPKKHKHNRVKDTFRSDKHRRYVASHPCVICAGVDVQCCHIRMFQQGGMGKKPTDALTVPLCIRCHTKQHTGSEYGYWKMYVKRNPYTVAKRMVDDSPDKDARMERELITALEERFNEGNISVS